jgi:tRNA(Ile)-lysidine synthase
MTDDRREPGLPTRLSAAVREAVVHARLIDRGEHVLVGVSGGPDSVALLHSLVLLRSELALRLTVCHVHHGLRPEADRDAAFVETLAGRLDCLVRVVRVDVPRGGGRSPEEAARIARHAALSRVARVTDAERIALGHTADDQAETVLMRILQGAGPRGLAGIPVRRGRIVRPLLAVDRAAVRAHLLAHGLDSLEDATNRDVSFLRNRVRHELLPLLAARAGVPLAEALRRIGRTARETVDALDALVRPRLAGHLTRTPVGWRLALAACSGLPPGAVKAVVRLALVEVAANDRLASGLRAAHLDALAGLLTAGTGARVRLPAGVVVERGRDALWVLRPAMPVEPASLAIPGHARMRDMVGVTAAVEAPRRGQPADPAWEAWFDAEALGLGGALGPSSAAGALLIRPRRPGERMVPFGGDEPVRLTKLLGAAGVPRHARARWPVVAREGEVLWLLGVRRGAAAPLTAATRTVLCLRAAPESPPGLPGCDAV